MSCSKCPTTVQRQTVTRTPEPGAAAVVRAVVRSSTEVDALKAKYVGYTASVRILGATSIEVTLTRNA